MNIRFDVMMKKLTAEWEYDACNLDRSKLAGSLNDDRKRRVFWSLCDRMEEYARDEMLGELGREDTRRKREIISRVRERICSLENAAFELAEQAMIDAVEFNEKAMAAPIIRRRVEESVRSMYCYGRIPAWHQPRESSSMLYVFPDE